MTIRDIHAIRELADQAQAELESGVIAGRVADQAFLDGVAQGLFWAAGAGSSSEELDALITRSLASLPAGYSVQFDEGDAPAWAIYSIDEDGAYYVDAVIDADYEVLTDEDTPLATVEAAAAAQITRHWHSLR